MGPAADQVTVAPREIRDLVYRCCRVAGCDGGAAERLSDSVLHAEIHRGGSVERFLDAIDVGPVEVMRLASAGDRVEQAEVVAGASGSAVARFEVRVPLMALSQSVSDARGRGFDAPGLAPTQSAAVDVVEIELVAAAPPQSERAAALRRHDAAHREGFQLSRRVLERLETAAHLFLVAESTLDAIVDDDSEAVPAAENRTTELPTTCVIGAGPNGLALARAFTAMGLPVQIYERHTSIGGLWAAGNAASPIYESAHFISSKTRSGFPGFPFPDSVSDYPGGDEIRSYLDDFAAKFGLDDVITTGCGVAHADWDGTSWTVALDDGTTRRFDHLVCANGSQWHPTMPDIAGRFSGRLIHSVEYSSIDELRHQRVLVIGAGNSGTDIACDAAAAASRAVLSMRRGYHFVPKHIFGIPSDVFATSGPELPVAISQRVFPALLRLLVGKPERFGLPEPDHKLFETHPIINSEIFHHLSHGDLAVRPDVDHFDGQDVHFVDGTVEQFDVVICATGYTIKVPFLDDSHFEWKHGKPQLLMELFSRTNPYLHATGFAEGDSGGFPLFDLMADAIANTIRLIGRAADGPPPQPWLDHLASARPATRGKAKLKDLPRNVNYIHRSAYEKVVASMRDEFGWREYSPPTDHSPQVTRGASI